MTSPLTAAELRRWAMRCASEAENLGTGDERRERLLKMREALFDLADSEDWLAGVGVQHAVNRERASDVQDAVDGMAGVTLSPGKL